jgi:hypothetical protein
MSYQKEYRKKNKDKLKQERKERYYKDRENNIKKSQEWYKNNKDHKKQYDKERNSKINISERNKAYYQNNKEVIKNKNKEYALNRYRNHENFKIRVNLKHRLLEAFKRYSKNGKIMSSKDYGIDWQAIIDYLGPCPGDRKDYHIDHILPLSAFNFNDLGQIKLAFAPENHRWLLKEENLKKHDKYDQNDLDIYLSKQEEI